MKEQQYLYFIKFSKRCGLVKIGITTNLKSRVDTLIRHHGSIDDISVYDGLCYKECEKILHKKLLGYNVPVGGDGGTEFFDCFGIDKFKSEISILLDILNMKEVSREKVDNIVITPKPSIKDKTNKPFKIVTEAYYQKTYPKLKACMENNLAEVKNILENVFEISNEYKGFGRRGESYYFNIKSNYHLNNGNISVFDAISCCNTTFQIRFSFRAAYNGEFFEMGVLTKDTLKNSIDEEKCRIAIQYHSLIDWYYEEYCSCFVILNLLTHEMTKYYR